MADRTWVNVRRDARGVAVLTIDNPAKLNTLNTAVMNDLIAAAEHLRRGPRPACRHPPRRR